MLNKSHLGMCMVTTGHFITTKILSGKESLGEQKQRQPVLSSCNAKPSVGSLSTRLESELTNS